MNLQNMKRISIDAVGMKSISINGVEIWREQKSYTNQVPISVDTDGSIYNGVGYKNNVRLSSSGGISGSAQDGSVTTGFIPWYGATTYLRLKGVEFVPEQGRHYYVNAYDASKKFLDYFSAAEMAANAHICTVSVANGVTTFKFSETYTGNTKLDLFRQAKYIRITAKGKGADMIVTLNEEIE